MNVDEKRKPRLQAKRRIKRVGNNLEKSINDRVISKALASTYNEFRHLDRSASKA